MIKIHSESRPWQYIKVKALGGGGGGGANINFYPNFKNSKQYRSNMTAI